MYPLWVLVTALTAGSRSMLVAPSALLGGWRNGDAGCLNLRLRRLDVDRVSSLDIAVANLALVDRVELEHGEPLIGSAWVNSQSLANALIDLLML